MTRNLRLKVVAEGIEDVDQLNYLTKQGCEIGQGYFFSKPLPVDAFEAYLQSAVAGSRTVNLHSPKVSYPRFGAAP